MSKPELPFTKPVHLPETDKNIKSVIDMILYILYILLLLYILHYPEIKPLSVKYTMDFLYRHIKETTLDSIEYEHRENNVRT